MLWFHPILDLGYSHAHPVQNALIRQELTAQQRITPIDRL
jgi:hypothetical protein